MLKFILLTVFLAMICSGQAEILNFVQVNPDTEILFSNSNGFAVKDGKLYFAFIRQTNNFYNVTIAISDDNGLNFTLYNLAELQHQFELKAPTILLNDDGSCDVFYLKAGDYKSPDMYRIRFNNGDILEEVLIKKDFNGDFNLDLTGDKYLITGVDNLFRQLCYYFHYTEKEITNLTNNTEHPASRISFTDNDLLNGRVHSNSDIWISSVSTPTPVNPNVPGMPLFTGELTTTGEIKIDSNPGGQGSEAFDQIFTGGYRENLEPLVVYKDKNTNIIAPLGTQASDDIDIVMITIMGGNAELLVGNIIETGVQEFTVYSSYPDALHPDLPIGEPLHTNYVSIKDTIWTNMGTINVQNSVIYIPAVIWISGTVSGTQVWVSGKDAYIVGHILYQCTQEGQSPEDNIYDYFGLVSEKSIYIKYKYKDPLTGEVIYHPTSVGPNGNTYIYGAYAALGEAGEGEWGFKEEGVFSYEYQHPHGSPTPFLGISPFTGADTLFANIDLHRFKYPPDHHTTNGPFWTRWPGISTLVNNGYPVVNSPEPYFYSVYDYPWYNPVYPEEHGGAVPTNPSKQITYMRGNLWLFGSVAQTRRGFLRRSGVLNASNIDMDNYWDIENYVFGGAHNSTGYNKKFSFDSRLEHNPFPWFPSVQTYDFKLTGFLSDQNTGEIGILDDLINDNYDDIKQFVKDNIVVFALQNSDNANNVSLKFSSDYGQSFNEQVLFNSKILSIEIVNHFAYIVYKNLNLENFTTLVLNTMNAEFVTVESGIAYNDLAIFKLIKTNNKLLLFIDYPDTHKVIYDFTDINNPELLKTLDFSGVNGQIKDYFFAVSQTDTLYVSIKTESNTEELINQNIYLGKVYIDGITPEIDTTTPGLYDFSMNCYPNPFNPETTIEFNLPSDQNVNLSIYNVRGQLIKTLSNEHLKKGKHSFVFDGKDRDTKALSSGIYFARLKSKNYNSVIKILLLK